MNMIQKALNCILAFVLVTLSPVIGAQVIQETVSDEGLVLIQETPELAFFGQRVWFRFELRNDSSSVQENLSLVLWHAYDNAQPHFIPNWCAFLPNYERPVLKCDFGDLQPGDSVETFLSVVPDMQVDDSPRIAVGSSTFDATLALHREIPTLHDTVTDSDRDGVTNFVERLSGTDPYDPESMDDSVWDIDMVAMYSSSAREKFADKGGIEAYIVGLFDLGNEILADSGARVRLNMLDVSELDIEVLETTDETISQFESDSTVRAKRAEFGADEILSILVYGRLVMRPLCCFH